MIKNEITICEPDTYKLTVKVKDEKYTYTITCPEGGNKFKGACKKSIPKIYMLIGKRNKMVCYVGQTIQTMARRFYAGFNAKRKYDWALNDGDFELLVWDVSDAVGANGKSLDSLESELVFLTRVYQGMWPRYQTSIKFNYPRNTSIGFHVTPFAQSMITNMFNFIKDLPENAGRKVNIDKEWEEFVLKNKALKL